MNMKKMTLVLWLMALLTSAFAGDNDSIQRPPIKGVVKVSGTLSAIKTGRLYLFESFGRSVNKLDSTLITSGAFEFPQRELELGIYMIGLNENNMCPVILFWISETRDEHELRELTRESGMGSLHAAGTRVIEGHQGCACWGGEES
jgi:hypothetical protein